MLLRRFGPSVLGAFAVACGLLLQWLLHVADPGVPFTPYSVGNWLIRNTPGALATQAIDSLGHNATAPHPGGATGIHRVVVEQG